MAAYNLNVVGNRQAELLRDFVDPLLQPDKALVAAGSMRESWASTKAAMEVEVRERATAARLKADSLTKFRNQLTELRAKERELEKQVVPFYSRLASKPRPSLL